LESPSVEHPAEESIVIEEVLLEDATPSEALTPGSPIAELPAVAETIAETVTESHSAELVAPEVVEIEWEPEESTAIEPTTIESVGADSPTMDLPLEEAHVSAEAVWESPAVEHPVEEGSAPNEFVAGEGSIVAEEATVAEEPAAEACATETDQVVQSPDTPSLDPAAAVEDGAHEIPAPDAEVSPAQEETPAVLSGTRKEHAASGSGFFDLTRVPEPEVMDDAEEVEAYASATAQAWLNMIDDSFVEHAAQVVKGRQRGRALDIGTGPGRIALKLALRLSLWKFIGVDRSQKMIDEALSNLAATAPVTGRLEFHLADGNRLDYPDASFDLVVCNSVLHHFAEPQNLLAEIARLAKPRGAILLRDLRRPSRLKYPFHVRWHGRRYTGAMNKLYRDSVRAAYTVPELQRMLDASPLCGARVFRHGTTHIGIERPYNW
jgi:ubiquinone/menaquinone biosynthesis C-methylase UbiE